MLSMQGLALLFVVYEWRLIYLFIKSLLWIYKQLTNPFFAHREMNVRIDNFYCHETFHQTWSTLYQRLFALLKWCMHVKLQCLSWYMPCACWLQSITVLTQIPFSCLPDSEWFEIFSHRKNRSSAKRQRSSNYATHQRTRKHHGKWK